MFQDLDRFAINPKNIVASNDTIKLNIGRKQLEHIAYDKLVIRCEQVPGPSSPATTPIIISEEEIKHADDKPVQCEGLTSGTKFKVRIDMLKSGWKTRNLYHNSHWTGKTTEMKKNTET